MNTRNSLKHRVAGYLKQHTEDWCYLGAMAKEFLGMNSSSTRGTIRSAFNNARYILEAEGSIVIPKLEAGIRGIEAYKIAIPEDKDYIVKFLLARKDRFNRLGKRTLNSFTSVKHQNLLPVSEIPALT